MPNQSWIKIKRENGKEDYAPVSRSRFYPEQSAKQLSKRNQQIQSNGNVDGIPESLSEVVEAVPNSGELQPGVHSTSPGHTLDQLYTPVKDADDSSKECNGMDGR